MIDDRFTVESWWRKGSKINLKVKFLIPALLVISLCSCQVGSLVPTSTPVDLLTPTDTARWELYEKALAEAIVNTNDALCEWGILGKSETEVYVYALCKVRSPIGTTGSIPAVIHLGKNRAIETVIIPRDGHYNDDIRTMFPPEIQEKIYSLGSEGFANEDHLNERLKNDAPPLIVESGTPMP